MNLTDLLKGKKIRYETDAKVTILLEIKEVKEKNQERELEPSTPANDWWPATQTWSTFEVTFSTGFKKEYDSLSMLLNSIIQN